MEQLKDEDFSKTELPFDLRQSFVILTTEIKKQIIVERNQKGFQAWFYLLDSLFIEISKNLTNKEMKEYEELLKKQSAILTKYEGSYLGKTARNTNEVYGALRVLDIWINRKMNEKKMFGYKDSDEGL